MAGYSDPQGTHNPATGTSPPASWGDLIRDDVVWLAGDSASGNPKPMCRVSNSAAISVANATATAVTFDTESYDVGGMHSTSSNTNRITIPSGGGGVYSIGGSIQWAANATGARAVYIRVNGATIIELDEITPFAAATITHGVSTQYKLAAADYVELIVNQTSGGALNTNAAASYAPIFYAHWVGVG